MNRRAAPTRWPWLLLATSVACLPTVPVEKVDDDAAVVDTGTPGTAAFESRAVLATVSDDYAVGALATVSLDDWAVRDQLTDISADPAVVATGEYVFQLNRYGYDTVRVYEPGEWSAPISEFALADLSNPHDVAMCGGAAFIAQYGTESLAVYNPDNGVLVGEVDLSSLSDGDGAAEVGTLVVAENGRLYVGVRALERTEWQSAGGAVAEVDCSSRTVSAHWEAASPDVYAWPDDPSVVAVYERSAGLRLLYTTSGELGPVVVSTGALGGEVDGFAAWGGRGVAIVASEDYDYSVVCVDPEDEAVVSVDRLEHYLISVAGNDRGEAWISARPHWTDPTASGGVLVYDIAACTELTEAPIATALAPYSIAFY